jgi:hypothetical protein
MCEKGSQEPELDQWTCPSGGRYRESRSFSLGGRCPMWIRRAEHYHDLSAAASRQLASQRKLANTLCEWRGSRTH